MLCTFCVASAWATVSLIDNKSESVEMPSKNTIPEEVDANAKAKAPEPATVALFGSGLISMLAGFVRKTYSTLKRILDIICTLLGMIFLAPIMAMVALLVKVTSPGPVIYSQIRVGENGKEFRIYKFRSMRQDAEKGTGAVWAQKNDSRLTPVGLFLRKSHLDELPQLFNVLRGEMSLIGPRPERPVFVEQFKQTIPGYEKRLHVKPGITGLAQVWHRYDETLDDVKKKLKYDLKYIKKMCLWSDFQILLRTVRVVFTGEGAK